MGKTTNGSCENKYTPTGIRKMNNAFKQLPQRNQNQGFWMKRIAHSLSSSELDPQLRVLSVEPHQCWVFNTQCCDQLLSAGSSLLPRRLVGLGGPEPEPHHRTVPIPVPPHSPSLLINTNPDNINNNNSSNNNRKIYDTNTSVFINNSNTSDEPGHQHQSNKIKTKSKSNTTKTKSKSNKTINFKKILDQLLSQYFSPWHVISKMSSF